MGATAREFSSKRRHREVAGDGKDSLGGDGKDSLGSDGKC